MSRPGQDVRDELLDFEVQSPVKLEGESPEQGNGDEIAATKVTGGGEHACGDKIEPDAQNLEDGEVKIEGQGNLEDGEVSEEEGGGQAGKGPGQAEVDNRRVCRHFAAGRTCLWGQVPPKITSKVISSQFLRIAGSCISRKPVGGAIIPCSLLEVQLKLLFL